jgi:phosphoglycolate phosphatase
MPPLYANFDAVVFDKDGTLLDFERTWFPAIGAGIAAFTADPATQRAIGDALGYDVAIGACVAGAPVVHVANSELAVLLDPHTGGRGRQLIDDVARRVVDHVTPVPAAQGVLDALAAAGVPAAVATNDDEAATVAQLAALGWERLPLVACDSGFGAKPAPGMLLEAAQRLGVEPARCAMVGDAESDLAAARAAGFGAAVLVGAGHGPDARALATVALDDVGGLLQPAPPPSRGLRAELESEAARGIAPEPSPQH